MCYSATKRRGLLLKVSELIEKKNKFLTEWESNDNGKPVSVASDVDIALAIKHFRYVAEWADKIQG